MVGGGSESAFMKEDGRVHLRFSGAPRKPSRVRGQPPQAGCYRAGNGTGEIAAEGWKESEDGLLASKDKV